MADDKKKTKIDLKARLGKTTQVGLGGAMPMPLPGPGGMPPPPPSSDRGAADSAPLPSTTASPAGVGSVRPPPNIAPPPGLSPGIPLPPFAQQPRQQPRAEPKQSAAQQTIKIEMGEEVAQEQKKARTRTAIYAVLTALVGAGLGFVAGGSKADGDRVHKAALGAEKLDKDVKAANDKLKELDAKLSDAQEKMKGKAFPDDLPTALAALKIPFDSSNLDGKDTGSLPTKVFKPLSDYTRSVDIVDKLRETLKNAATLAKDPLTKAWKEEAPGAAMTGFSVLFRNEGGKGIVAEIVTNKEPFLWKGDFKKEYTVTTGGARPQDKNATRWEKGDPGGTIVPLDPSSMKPFQNDPSVGRFLKALIDIKAELEGNHDNPTNEIPGLLKMGEDLDHALSDYASRNK
jgi:hypothetical protein